MVFCIAILVFDAAESASDVEGGDDFRVATRSEGKIYEVDYTSLSQPDVEKMIKTEVDHIGGIFGVEVRHAAL